MSAGGRPRNSARIEEDMKLPSAKRLSVALFLALSIVADFARASGGLTGQIKEAVIKTRSSKTVDARTEAAKHLASLTQKMDSKDISDALVTEITSLLDFPDDSVRYWVATALGNLGPAAKSAAPKLEQMLPEADCINGTITSASGIRYALIRMGIKPPPAPKCNRIAG
jgi:hypothetical protein